MKNAISNLPLLAFSAFLLLLPGLIALKKTPTDPHQPTFHEQLAHKWEIKSFTIDGVEVKGSVIKASTLQFGTYQGANGDFRWTIHYQDDTRETQSGHYTVDENTQQIDVENQEHEHFQFQAQLGENELQLTGSLDGERYVLTAKRDWK